MKFSRTLLAIAVIGLFGVASAEVDTAMKIDIQVSGDSGTEDVRIEFDSADAGFDLHDMQVGENRSIVDKSGKAVLVTRQENGYTFDVDGKTIEMPLFDGEHHKQVWVGDGMDHDVDVHMMGGAGFVSAESMNGVMIMSGEPIDDATQAAITSLLESAGHGSDVNFVSHEQHQVGGEHHVKVIRKVVETRQ